MSSGVISRERKHREEISLKGWDGGVRRRSRVQCWKAEIEVPVGFCNWRNLAIGWISEPEVQEKLDPQYIFG